MAERADVVVVGAGVMGLAAARALAQADREPLVLEQFRIGHQHGSSHGATRIFRLAYDEPEWVHLAQEALPLWRELEAESGEQLLDFTGLVDLPLDVDLLLATLEACGTPHELLSAGEVRHRFGLATHCCQAVWQPDAGVVLAERALRALQAGRAVRDETRVRRLVPEGGAVRVETDRGSIEAETVVVSAGAWARRLLAEAGIELPVVPTRETVAYFRVGRDVPSVIDYAGRETYALTAFDGLVKVGVHRSGPPADPDAEGTPDEETVRFASDWAARTFGLADPRPVAVETCLYTNTADAGFVLERHGPIVVCSACSGHGFKFAPAVGRRVAQLAT
jgi:sarcosine oxidase